MTEPGGHILALDAGGTWLRLALAAPGGELAEARRYKACEHESIGHAIRAYLDEVRAEMPGTVSLCTAARQAGDEWIFTNANKWRIAPERLRAELGCAALYMLNDFAANAYGLAGGAAATPVREGAAPPGALRCVMGPGTGLGLAYFETGGAVRETFGGHMLIAAATPEQAALIASRAAKAGGKTMVPEYYLSGAGLVNLYQDVCERENAAARAGSPDELLRLARDGNAQALCAVRLFHEFFGLFAHNACVTAHAFGGVYLCGGVLEALIAAGLWEAPRFLQAMALNMVPPVRAALEVVPVYIVDDPLIGLRGAAAFAAQGAERGAA